MFMFLMIVHCCCWKLLVVTRWRRQPAVDLRHVVQLPVLICGDWVQPCGCSGAAPVHPGGFSGLECEECQYSGLDLSSSLGARACTLLVEEKSSTLKCSHCGGQRSGLTDSYCAVCTQKLKKMTRRSDALSYQSDD